MECASCCFYDNVRLYIFSNSFPPFIFLRILFCRIHLIIKADFPVLRWTRLYNPTGQDVGSFQLDYFIISSKSYWKNISMPNGHCGIYNVFGCLLSFCMCPLLNCTSLSALSIFASEISFVSCSYPKMSFSKNIYKNERGEETKKGP